MKHPYYILTLLAISGILLSIPQASFAQYGQYGQGAPSPGSKIIVDKKVATPGSATGKSGELAGVYVDNLMVNDSRYSPGQEVIFKITVVNRGNTVLRNIVVRDTIPAQSEPVIGPGTYDASTRSITYTIPQLQAGEENTQYLRLKVVSQSQLPPERSIIQQVNAVEASVEGTKDTDTAQYFIEKTVKPVATVPDTGPGLGVAFLAIQAVGLMVGLKLRKHGV